MDSLGRSPGYDRRSPTKSYGYPPLVSLDRHRRLLHRLHDRLDRTGDSTTPNWDLRERTFVRGVVCRICRCFDSSCWQRRHETAICVSTFCTGIWLLLLQLVHGSENDRPEQIRIKRHSWPIMNVRLWKNMARSCRNAAPKQLLGRC